MENPAIMVLLIVLALVVFIEFYPHFEGTIISSGTEMSDALGYTPDTGQFSVVRGVLWSAAIILVILGIFKELGG